MKSEEIKKLVAKFLKPASGEPSARQSGERRTKEG